MAGKGKQKVKDTLWGVQTQHLKHLSKHDYETLLILSRMSKNIFNVALYNVRQHFFDEKKYLCYEENYHLCKLNDNYKLLNANSAQQIIKVVDRSFKSFFELLKMAKSGAYQYSQINIPHYLKKDSCFSLIFSEFNIKNGIFTVPMSVAFKRERGKVEINVPANLNDKKIKEVRIIPKNNARFFEVQYVYEIEEVQSNTDKNNILAVDLGVDNLAACVTNSGKSFILDGKRLKSINQWYNKENARLQGIKDKQKIKGTTNKQKRLSKNRKNKVNDYMRKSARIIIDYCIKNNIGKIIIGYNKDIQEGSNLGKVNNQNFVNIPIGELRTKTEYLSKRYGIEYIEQEESYTSKADFFAGDEIPGYTKLNKKTYTFSGKRIKRGLYRSNIEIEINADINGALNIMRKNGIKNIELKSREYVSPKRIKIN